MKKAISFATIIGFILITSQVFAVTQQEKLTYGYDGVKWGAALSKNKDFVTVPNKTLIQFVDAVAYESPSHTNVIFEGRNLISAEKVIFVCLKGKFSAVSIVVKSGQNDEVPQSFFLIAKYAKELYGEPTSGSIYTSNELFYKKNTVHMKIQLRKNPRRSNVLIYAPKY